ncbi:MAG TPA: replicative DNA helicase [Arachidicoccus sp.]|nr:replicative DNA helicase [Arachidicoccus sp.]
MDNLSNINRKTGRKKPATDISSVMYGKVPPQARELEEVILGAVMLEKAAFDNVIEIIRAECFYVDAHQKIFHACEKLAQKNMPIDMLTVVEELKANDELDLVGGAFYVSKLTMSVASSANIETHARILLEKFIQRKLIEISGEIITEAYIESTDVFNLLDDAEQKIFNITNNYLKKNYDDIGDALAKALDRIDKLRLQTNEISGVPSGFASLDRVTYGWQPSDLIILAARPAVGKTAFALNLIRNAAMHPTHPTPVAFFSLEMSSAQLVQRILSAQSEIKLEKISRGNLEEYEYKQLQAKGIKPLETSPIFIDDTAALNIFEFRAKARRLVNKSKVGLIVIDYLQLMSGSGDRNTNREQEISTISRNLKVLAKELQIPIIALSQLSRAVESRKESKIPQLSDLRESGAIEQDADMVMFIYRPEYYEINNNEHGETTQGETLIKIAKHRNGSLETIKLRARLDIQKFEDAEDSNFNPGSWQQLPSSPAGPAGSGAGGGDAQLFISRQSKMNEGEFDEGFDNNAPPF